MDTIKFVSSIMFPDCSFILFVVITLTQCAKRIDVKKRMAQGLAKRNLHTMELSDVLQALVKKRVSYSQNTKTTWNIDGMYEVCFILNVIQRI